MKIAWVIATALLWGAPDTVPTPSSQPSHTMAKKYLALGDSYTIGTKLEDPKKAFPHQLVDRLKEDGIDMEEPKIIAKNGWTTADLTRAIKKEKPDEDYDLVSVLIGVNDQYNDKPFDEFRPALSSILDDAVKMAGGNRNRVFVISIPDYGVTPHGQKRDTHKISMEVKQYNRVVKAVANMRGISFFNVTDISLRSANEPDLIAKDGLHPAAGQYKMWVDTFYDRIKAKLDD